MHSAGFGISVMKSVLIIVSGLILYAYLIGNKKNPMTVNVSVNKTAPVPAIAVGDLDGIGLGGGGGGGVNNSKSGGGLLDYSDNRFYDPFDTAFFRGELDWQRQRSYREGNPYKPGVIDVNAL